MLLRGGNTRIGAAALLAVLVMVLAAPAGAAPWGGFGEAREWGGGFLPRVLAWLGLAPDPGASSKCDGGSQIDPNGGCPKVLSLAPDPGTSSQCDDSSTIDPNGCPKAVGAASGRGMRADVGSRVAPGHRR